MLTLLVYFLFTNFWYLGYWFSYIMINPLLL